MKIQLDMDNKTIKINESVKLTDLFDLLEKLLPKGEWKEFSLERFDVVTWSTPVYIDRIVKPIAPMYPWYIVNPDTLNNITLCSSGTFNIEC